MISHSGTLIHSFRQLRSVIDRRKILAPVVGGKINSFRYMISSVERELIVAYFQGGNAKDMNEVALGKMLQTIKEATKDSLIPPEERMAKVMYPSGLRRNPAR